MEKIGYIKREKLKLHAGKNDVESIISSITFDCRDEVEQRDDVIQVICAGVILTDKEVLTIKKSKQSTGSDSPEKDKILLYIGGHLDEADKVEDFVETLKNGMKREILEEINYTVKDNEIGYPIAVYMPVNDKSKRHLGVIFPVKINKQFNRGFTDGKCKFVDINKVENINNLEEWSKIILKEFILRNI